MIIYTLLNRGFYAIIYMEYCVFQNGLTEMLI